MNIDNLLKIKKEIDGIKEAGEAYEKLISEALEQRNFAVELIDKSILELKKLQEPEGFRVHWEYQKIINDLITATRLIINFWR